LARARDAPSDCTASSSAGSIDWIELRIGKIMNGRKTCTNPPTALYISVRLYGNRPRFFTALLIRPLLAKRMIRP
jgi:hypothetical protein